MVNFILKFELMDSNLFYCKPMNLVLYYFA